MYLLRLACSPEETDSLSAELWQAGTIGIEESDNGGSVLLLAFFEDDRANSDLLHRFRTYSPEWHEAESTDWVETTQRAWPARAIGKRLFLTPSWNLEPTPDDRLRIIHNPGLACGTGEHPCTQLALISLEQQVTRASRVVDIGTGSGILALAALHLGATFVAAVDIDAAALNAARDNFHLNQFAPLLINGSADALATACADITVANISASVLLSIADDLIRITRPNGRLILTGFPEAEAQRLEQIFPHPEVSAIDEWRCLVTTPS